MFFPISSFYHLTGIKAYDLEGKELSSYNFYNLLHKSRIDKMKLIKKDSTTYYKMQVLPQLMRIDRNAKMIGDFCGNNIFLQTEKVAGNVNACMGFIKNDKYHVYIPNTALKEDIRNITNSKAKIIAILKKEMDEKLYRNITYLKQNYEISKILNNEEINNTIDIKNLFSADQIINQKINNFSKESNYN